MVELRPMTAQEACASLQFSVSEPALKDLTWFLDYLAEKNEVMNLVGPATIAHFWQRHFLDSAQLLNFAPNARTWADLGAGAGFPGVVLAILFKHGITGEQKTIALVDSQGKRCRFLETVVAELKLPATVINERAEKVDLTCDVITARAFAPLERLLTYAENYFKKGAEGWILKGENLDSEVGPAGKVFRFELKTYTSLSDPRGRVVHLKDVKRVHARK